ncbi:hypothetical protein FVE85_1132 [Porphyridium purpureum]|uniref:Uncharacterized protein n=1 Tax=Porphyridium purpureum TaxID=35688 RepID=A0A5J4Z392_PORPP|nr:hypothetical protein FVE85_1132 [Porphyridium purpureum]|eukprot:POR1287..scf208_2
MAESAAASAGASINWSPTSESSQIPQEAITQGYEPGGVIPLVPLTATNYDSFCRTINLNLPSFLGKFANDAKMCIKAGRQLVPTGTDDSSMLAFIVTKHFGRRLHHAIMLALNTDTKYADNIKSHAIIANTQNGYELMGVLQRVQQGHSKSDTECGISNITRLQCRGMHDMQDFLTKMATEVSRANIDPTSPTNEPLLKGFLKPKIEHIPDAMLTYKLSVATGDTYVEIVEKLMYEAEGYRKHDNGYAGSENRDMPELKNKTNLCKFCAKNYSYIPVNGRRCRPGKCKRNPDSPSYIPPEERRKYAEAKKSQKSTNEYADASEHDQDAMNMWAEIVNNEDQA